MPLLGIVCSALLGISSYYTIHELLYYHNRAVNFFQFVNTAKPQIDIIVFFRDLTHNHHKENPIKPMNSQTNLSSFPYYIQPWCIVGLEPTFLLHKGAFSPIKLNTYMFHTFLVLRLMLKHSLDLNQEYDFSCVIITLLRYVEIVIFITMFL